jgi:protein required for attachment to host cells
MRNKKTRVVVANGRKARLFDWETRKDPLVPAADHLWTAAEPAEHADAQGMTHSRVGPSRHRLAPHNDSEEIALDDFARQIGDRLAGSLQDGDYERLLLVAAPRLMGRLRDHLSPEVRAVTWQEIDKDLTHLPRTELDEALRALLAA